jgi:hypothetical protein
MVGSEYDVANLPVIQTGTMVGIFSGKAKVISETNDEVEVEFEFASSDHTQKMRIDVFKSTVQTTVSAAHPLTIPPASIGRELFDLIKKLPESVALPADQICALEADTVTAHALGTASSAPIRETDVAWVAGLVAELTKVAALLAKGNSTGATWPNLHADRLGKSIKSRATAAPSGSSTGTSNGSSTGGGNSAVSTAAVHPRASAMKGLVSGEDVWKTFLSDSLQITCSDAARITLAKTSDFMMTGALDAYLKRCGQEGTVESLSTRPGNLGSDELLSMLMFEFNTENNSVGSASSSGTIKVSVNNAGLDTTGTDEERARRSALRSDAEIVHEDKKLRLQLVGLHALTGDGSAGQLVEAMTKIEDPSLFRVVSSDSDIEKSLNGKQLPIRLAPKQQFACMHPTIKHTLHASEHCTHAYTRASHAPAQPMSRPQH